MTPGEPPGDVVVIGSGVGGAFAAMALAEGGARVLLLERERRFDPRRDFPMIHPDWEIRPNPFAETGDPRDDPSLVVEEGPPLDPRYARLRSSSGSGGAAAVMPEWCRPVSSQRPCRRSKSTRLWVRSPLPASAAKASCSSSDRPSCPESRAVVTGKPRARSIAASTTETSSSQ